MTSDPAPDADPAVKPQVIDLDAVDVTGSEAPKDSAAPPPRQPPVNDIPQRARRSWVWPVAALVVGAVIGGWLYRDLLSSYLPSSAMSEMGNRIGALEVTNKSITDQLAAFKQANDKRNADLDTAMGDAVTAASDSKAAVQKFEPRLAELEKGIAAGKADLDKLRASLASLPAGSGGGTSDPAALAAISQRLDAVEKDMAALKAGSGSAESATVVSALRQALSDIQAKIAAGTAYRADYDRIVQMVPAAADDLLASYADNGLANAASLAGELRAAAAGLPKPEAAAAATGYVSSLWQALTSVVTVRDVGAVDWPGLCETAAKLADNGKLGEAVASLDGAQATLPEAIAHWRDRAVARVKLEGAAADLAKAVELTLAAKGGGN